MRWIQIIAAFHRANKINNNNNNNEKARSIFRKDTFLAHKATHILKVFAQVIESIWMRDIIIII
jgi:hypothetical protein